MPQTIRTRSGRTLILPTPEEDATDPDALPLTDAKWEAVKPFDGVTAQPATVTKERVTSSGFRA